MNRSGTIAQRTTAASGMFIAARIGARLVDLLTVTILARLLTPEDFGLIAIAVVLMQILETVLEVPFYQALIRARPLRRELVHTAFTLSLGRGLLTAGLLMVAAAPAAWFYDDPRLVPLIIALGAAPLARSLRSPRMIHYARRLDARPEFAIEVIGKLAALLAAGALAWLTGSYWAIAIAAIAPPLAGMAISYVYAPYAPRIRLSDWRYFLAFAGWLSLDHVFAAMLWQFDKLFLGARVPEAVLGGYYMAFTLAVLPYTAIIQPVLRPFAAAFALSEARSSLPDAYGKALSAINLVSIPVVALFALLADPIVRVLLGPGWENISLWVGLLALTALIAVFQQVLTALCVALHKTFSVAARSGITLLVFVPLMVVGFEMYGLIGVIWARLLTGVITFPLILLLAKRLTGMTMLRQLAHARRAAIAGLALTAAVILTLNLIPASDGLLETFFRAAAAGGAGLAVYGAAAMALWSVAGCPAGLEQIAVSLAMRLLERVRLRTARGDSG